jgi:predicted restriction endonuclease
VGGCGLKRNPECVEAFLEAVNGQGKVRRVEIAKTILQALNGRCKSCGLFAELSLKALHIRRECIGPIAQVRDNSATDIDEICFGGGGMCLHS